MIGWTGSQILNRFHPLLVQESEPSDHLKNGHIHDALQRSVVVHHSAGEAVKSSLAVDEIQQLK